MPALHCEASIVINASLDTIQAEIADFRRWPLWSPWLYVEPDATIVYQGEAGEPGHGYHWTGRKTGEGKMSIRALESRQMDADLTFIKPFRSTADVRFRLEALEKERTRVYWSMASQLPWFLFFMKNTMTAMIRSDYQRGLAMLKDLVEIGRVPSRTVTEGEENVSEQPYVGQRRSCRLDEIGSVIETALGNISDALASSDAQPSDTPLVLYESMDIKSSTCVAVVALPTDTRLEMTGDFVTGVRPSGKALKFTHHGAYRHLGNAWHQAMGELKVRKLKSAPKVSPFERYVSDPDEVAESDCITEIYLPLR